jgi:membrane protein YdbS with pleckstrin-like domain
METKLRNLEPPITAQRGNKTTFQPHIFYGQVYFSRWTVTVDETPPLTFHATVITLLLIFIFYFLKIPQFHRFGKMY